MNADEIAAQVVSVLNRHHIEYMVVGSLSTNFHSIPRSTRDADIVVKANLGKTARMIVKEYDALRMDPQIGFESVTGTKKIVLEAPDSEGFQVELFELADDEHDQERFRRRMQIEWLGDDVCFATAEDTIITKLRWSEKLARPKDIEDAKGVLAVQNEALDYDYLETWCRRHGTSHLLNDLREKINEYLD